MPAFLHLHNPRKHNDTTLLVYCIILYCIQIKSNQTNYFIVRLKVDQRAGQLSLPHLGITKTEKNRTKT